MSSKYTDEEKAQILEDFAHKILDQVVPIPEFDAMVNENFWELLDND